MIKSLISLTAPISHSNIGYKIGETGKGLIDKMCYGLLKDNINTRTIDLLNNELENKNIALIGNSPIIINGNKGEEIDGHDIVIRLNKGIIGLDKTKDDTGTKTNMYSTYPMDVLLSKAVKQKVKKEVEKIIIPVPYKSKIMGSTNIFYMQNLKDFNSKEKEIILGLIDNKDIFT